MKRFIAAAIAFLVATTTRAATQTSFGRVERSYTTNKQLHLNPLVGVMASGLAGSGHSSRNFGVVAGTLITFGREVLTFESGGVFTQQGGSSVAFNYVGVPLFAKYTIRGEERTDLHLRAGFIPEYQISTRILTPGAVKRRDLTNRFDTLATLGLGASLPVGGSKLTLDALYNRGLMRLNTSGAPLYNQSLMVAGGVLF